MEIRRARPDDFSDILRTQSANLAWNLTGAERAGGFLSAEFTRKHLEEIAEGIALLVASDGGRTAGYLCAYSCAYAKQFAILAEMIKAFDRVPYKGKPLRSYSSFVYGPVCIGRSYRGQGLLRQLYELLLKVSREYDVGIAFVSQDNPHSLAAHVDGLKMVNAGAFDFKGRTYDILVFDT